MLRYYHLKSGLDYKWFNHLNTGHSKVRFSDESGIQVFGIQVFRIKVFGIQVFGIQMVTIM